VRSISAAERASGVRMGESIAWELRDNALFVAFAPADKPKIALAMVVENAGFGASAAAPIARKALDYYLLGKRPVDKTKPPVPKEEPVVAQDAAAEPGTPGNKE
jgi:penicillin-binding protein 2